MSKKVKQNSSLNTYSNLFDKQLTANLPLAEEHCAEIIHRKTLSNDKAAKLKSYIGSKKLFYFVTSYSNIKIDILGNKKCFNYCDVEAFTCYEPELDDILKDYEYQFHLLEKYPTFVKIINH